MMDEATVSNQSQGEVQSVLGFWQQFDFLNTRSTWDKACEEMREYKTASINGRKRLNDITKLFRSKSKDEQLVIFNDLLKAYQEEIDQLSRRSKFCEGAYGNIYKSLYEAPDPVPAINQLINSVAGTTVHTLEIQRLKNELNQYEEEFKRLKNQEVTIRQLEAIIEEYKENNEVKIQEEIENQMTLLREQTQQEILEQQSITKSMEKRVQQIQELNKVLDGKNTSLQSELLTVSMTKEAKLSHLENEKSILADTIQRLQLQNIALENEITQARMKQEGNSNTSAGSPIPSHASSASFRNMEEYDQLIGQYKEELTKQQEIFLTEKFSMQELMQSVQEQLQLEKEKSKSLQQELAQCPKKTDYLALRKRLFVVEQIAFHHDDAVTSSPTAMTSSASSTMTMKAMDELGEDMMSPNAPEQTSMISLELLLTNKIKGLEKELVEIRKVQFESDQSLQQQKDTLQQNADLIQKQFHTIHKLEEELEKRNKTMDKIMLSMTTQKENSLPDLSDLLLGDSSEKVSSTTDIAIVSSTTISSKRSSNINASSLVNTNTNISELPTSNTNNAAGNQDQMILILQTQRDRYKEKLTLVEGTYLHVQEQLTALQQQHERLQEENISLYRKVKFMQSYQSSRNTNGGSSAMVGNHHPGRIECYHHSGQTPLKAPRGASSGGYDEESRYSDDHGVSGYGNHPSNGPGNNNNNNSNNQDIESKYAQLYETQLNPFIEFSSFEKQRKLSELSVADRIVLNTALAIISNNVGRNVLLIYFAAMHVLVFATIYYVSHNVHHGCDPGLDNLHHHLHAAATAAAATAI